MAGLNSARIGPEGRRRPDGGLLPGRPGQQRDQHQLCGRRRAPDRCPEAAERQRRAAVCRWPCCGSGRLQQFDLQLSPSGLSGRRRGRRAEAERHHGRRHRRLHRAAGPAVQPGYAFRDGVHPTTAGHALIAATVTQYVQAPVFAGVFSALGEQTSDDRHTGMARALDRLDNIRFGKPGVNDDVVNVFGGVSNGDSAATRPGFRSSNLGVNFGMNRALTSNLGADSHWFGRRRHDQGCVDPQRRHLQRSLRYRRHLQCRQLFCQDRARTGLGHGVTRPGDRECRTLGPLANRRSVTAVSCNAGFEAGLHPQPWDGRAVAARAWPGSGAWSTRIARQRRHRQHAWPEGFRHRAGRLRALCDLFRQ